MIINQVVKIDNSSIPTIPSTLIKSALNALDGVSCQSTSAVTPDTLSEEVTVRRIAPGVTNQVFAITTVESNHTFVLRIYGTDTADLIDRNISCAANAAAAEIGVAPNVIVRFVNGQIEEFSLGSMLTQPCFSDAKTLTCVAETIANLHNAPIPSVIAATDETHPFLSMLSKWITLADELSTTCLPIELLHIERLYIEQLLRIPDAPCAATRFANERVLGHNDLIGTNILIESTADGQAVRANLVDFDYAGVTVRAWDIGVLMGGYETLTPSEHVFFLEQYVEASYALSGAFIHDDKHFLRAFGAWIARFACAVSLLNVVWFVICGETPSTTIAQGGTPHCQRASNFRKEASHRLTAYYTRKARLHITDEHINY